MPDLPLPTSALPSVVLVPSRPLPADADRAFLVLRGVEGRGLVLPLYSSLAELVRCCGPDQAWVALPADIATTVAADAGAAAVVLDAVLRSPP